MPRPLFSCFVEGGDVHTYTCRDGVGVGWEFVGAPARVQCDVSRTSCVCVSHSAVSDFVIPWNVAPSVH